MKVDGPGAGPRTVAVTELGRVAYRPVWELQRRLVAELRQGLDRDRLLLVEHHPVITIGRRGRDEHVLADRSHLASRGVEVVRVERGGEVTYHGPGQLVAYPVLDLRRHRRDLRWYLGALLEVIVRTVAPFGLAATARDGEETGVWVETSDGSAAKLASVGVRVEGWISYHGISLNVDPPLRDFGWIVPCGLVGAEMTSLARSLGRAVEPADVRRAFRAAFAGVFAVELVEVGAEELVGWAPKPVAPSRTWGGA